MADIQNLNEPWQGHTGKEVEDFIKGELQDNADAIYNMLYKDVNIDTDNYDRISFVISPNGKWYNNNNDPTHFSKVIPLPDGLTKISLKLTTNVMFWSLLSEYETPVHNTAVHTIATGLDARYEGRADTEVTQFSNAKYIVVRADTVNGAGCPIIRFYFNSQLWDTIDNLDARTDALAKQLHSEIEIEKSGTAALNCYLYHNNGVATWQNGTTLNNGKFFRIEAGCTYLVVGNKVNEGCRFAFVVDDTHVTGEVDNFATGWSDYASVGANENAVVTAPSDAVYLFCNTHNSQGDIEPSKIAKVVTIQEMDSMLTTELALGDIVPGYIINNPVRVNINAFVEHDASLGGSKKWVFYANKLYGKHKAIPVTAGDKYIIRCSNKLNFWGWVNNTYSPEYGNNTTIPFVDGYDRVKATGNAVFETVPEGAAYLIVGTANGSGNTSMWDVIKYDSANLRNRYFKFRFATWNIGCFKYYDYKNTHETSDITDADAAMKALEYRKEINSIGADIFGVCEYAVKYPRSTSSGETKDLILQCYRKSNIGTYYGMAACNALFFNSPQLTATTEKVYEHTVKKDIDSSASQRYYLDTVLDINGIAVHVVETHLDHTYSEIRASQLQELADTFGGYDHVILAGDFNTANAETFDSDIAILTDAGFTVANGGYIGDFVTNEDGWKIDNIAVKGFAMSNINVVEDAGNLSDHWIVYCDLEKM